MSYEHNFRSGMALVKREGRYELVESRQITDDIMKYHPQPLPYEYRDLLQDETPREFRFICPNLSEPDPVLERGDALIIKATQFFANGCEVFARTHGELCTHACSCATDDDAKLAAYVMEEQRRVLEEMSDFQRKRNECT